MESIIGWAISAAMVSPYSAGFVLLMAAVGTLYSIAKVIVKMTPSTTDDKWLEGLDKIPVLGQLLRASAKFSKIKPK